MTWVAIGAYAVYLLVGFVVRTIIQVRRTGDSGFRGLSGRPGTAEWWAGILFVVALLVGVCAPSPASWVCPRSAGWTTAASTSSVSCSPR